MLGKQKFFLFDCQTTGTNPDRNYLLEVAWGIYEAQLNPDCWQLEHFLVTLPEDYQLPRSIQKLTGIRPEQIVPFEKSVSSYIQVCHTFFNAWQSSGYLPLLIHFAQFETAFLKTMAADIGLPWSDHWQIICTFSLAKQLVPGLRSYSLRATAGYLGYSLPEMKRSEHHLRATAYIWRELVEILKGHKIATFDSNFLAFIRQHSNKKSGSFKSKISPELRLNLPNEPGVYRMKDRQNQVLYVGKAVNLKSRVNSYFRGRSSKGSRINELLTRVDDIETTSVKSPIAALLLENDEIKRFDPPYNRQLRAHDRQISGIMLNDLEPLNLASSASLLQSWVPMPVRILNEIKGLIDTFKSYSPVVNLWGVKFPHEMFCQALDLVFESYDLLEKASKDHYPWDQLLPTLWGRYLIELRQRNLEERLAYHNRQSLVESVEESDDLEQETDAEFVWTTEACAQAFTSYLKHIVKQRYRSRWFVRLTESEIVLQESTKRSTHIWTKISCYGQTYQIETFKKPPPALQAPKKWQRAVRDRAKGFDITTFDRMKILYSQLRLHSLKRESVKLCLRPGLVLDQDQLIHWLV